MDVLETGLGTPNIADSNESTVKAAEAPVQSDARTEQVSEGAAGNNQLALQEHEGRENEQPEPQHAEPMMEPQHAEPTIEDRCEPQESPPIYY